MRTKLQEIKRELRWRMHQPIPEQGQWLKQVVTGFFAYHAVPTNFPALGAFRLHTIRLWRRALRRRSQKDRVTWQRIEQLAVKHPRWEPYAGKPHVRICAGGIP
jgi:RNA-directed DNA polymerase